MEENIGVDLHDTGLDTFLRYDTKSTYNKKEKQIITTDSKDMEKLQPSFTAGKSKIVQQLWKTVWQLLKRIKKLPHQPSNSTPEYMPKRNENTATQKAIHECLEQFYL